MRGIAVVAVGEQKLVSSLIQSVLMVYGQYDGNVAARRKPPLSFLWEP